MRMKPNHVRTPDCTATVISRTPLFYCSPGTYNYGQPVHDFKVVDGKYVKGPHVHTAELSCGHSHEDLPVGTTITCEACKKDNENLAKLEEALKAGIVSHTRCHSVIPSSISIYRYDDKSPTGVLALGFCVDDTPMAEEILRKYRGMAPLSPTEKR